MELDLKILYHHAPCGYLYTMEDGALIDANDTFLAFTGYSREEIIENKYSYKRERTVKAIG